MPTVELIHVSKVYGRGARAVNDVSLSIRDGEFLVLVGPSGCGKSTLLRMVAGLEEVTEGEVRIGGRVVNDVAPRDRDIAMVFQNYALYPHMTVYDNLAFGLRRRKVPAAEIDIRVRAAAGTLGLDIHLRHKPGELSGGERQRVALGRALVREPRVFLFDEPLSNLDARLRVQMRAEIKRLHRRVETTMIYVTHDQVEAMTLGDRIAVLDHGRLQQVADPYQLYERPANRFVAGFIGTPPINFLQATLDSSGGTLRIGESSVPLPHEIARGLVLRTVLLGVRPEDVTLEQEGPGPSLAGVVEVSEPLGNEVLVHFATAAGPVVTRRTGQISPALGSTAVLHFAFDRLHWFDPDNGVALDLDGHASD